MKAIALSPLLALAVVAAGPCLAQEKLTERSFFPAEYPGEAFADLQALRDSGIWGGIERSLFAALLDQFESAFGFPLDEVDSIRSVPGPHVADNGYRGHVTVILGSEEIGLPDLTGGQVAEEQFGGLTALVEKSEWSPGGGTIYVSPRPGALVLGDIGLMQPVLEGKRKGGVPAGELLAITAARGNLAYLAMAIEKRDLVGFPGLADELWVDEDPITFLLLRIREQGAGDEARVLIEGRLRFAKGEAGLERAEKRIRQGLESARSHPRLGALKRYWNAIEIARDGQDLKLSLDLGSPRQASSTLPLLVAPVFLLGRPVEAVEAAPVAPAPKPASRPQGDKGKKKDG